MEGGRGRGREVEAGTLAILVFLIRRPGARLSQLEKFRLVVLVIQSLGPAGNSFHMASTFIATERYLLETESI